MFCSLLLFLPLALKLVDAKPVFSADKIFTNQQCASLISAINDAAPGANKLLSSLPADLATAVHNAVSSHANAYVLEQTIYPLEKDEVLMDSGHYWMTFNDTIGKDVLLIDPRPQTQNFIFGAFVMLNDNVAGGQLSIETGAVEPLVFQPDCGRIVFFPFTFAIPKTIKRVKVGKLYMISVAFYVVSSTQIE